MALLFGALMLWIAYLGIRKTGAEGWMALPAAVLTVLVANQWLLLKLHVRSNYFYLFGVNIPFGRIAMFGSLGIITVLMVRRFLQGQRQREQWKLEIEQARQVQQLLVPANSPATPGFAVESVYLPAQQVGGDFFQISAGRGRVAAHRGWRCERQRVESRDDGGARLSARCATRRTDGPRKSCAT